PADAGEAGAAPAGGHSPRPPGTARRGRQALRARRQAAQVERQKEADQGYRTGRRDPQGVLDLGGGARRRVTATSGRRIAHGGMGNGMGNRRKVPTEENLM